MTITNLASRVRAFAHRARRVRYIALGPVAAVVALLAAAPSAEAAVPATSYLTGNYSCIAIAGYYGEMTFSRPYAVANYAGTTEVYWSADIQVLIGGVYYNVPGLQGLDAASDTIWGRSGSQLSPLYWNNQANNTGVSADVPLGHSYRVVAHTWWWNGRNWFAESTSATMACNF